MKNNTFLRDVIVQYIEDAMISGFVESGLSRIEIPTGYGKTKAVQMAIPILLKKFPDLRIFYVSPLTTELNPKAIREEFRRNDFNQEWINENFLVIKPVAENVIHTLSKYDEVIKEIQKLAQEYSTKYQNDDMELLLEFLDLVRVYKNLKEGTSIKNSYKEKLVKEEGNFRRLFKKLLRSHYDGKLTNDELREKALEDFSFIREMYPQCELDKKHLVVMTTKMLALKHVPFFGPSHSWLDVEHLNGAVVFLDEFDAAKVVLLDVFIESSATILEINSIANRLVQARSEIENNLKPGQAKGGLTREQWMELVKQPIPSEFYDFGIKLEDMETRGFLFRSKKQKKHMSSSNLKDYYLSTEKKAIDSFTFCTPVVKNDSGSSVSLLYFIMSNVDLVLNYVTQVALNLLNDPNYSDSDTYYSKISDFIEEISMPIGNRTNDENNLVSFINSAVIRLKYGRGRKKNHTNLGDDSVIMNGFETTFSEKDISKDNHTPFTYVSFDMTPERFLYELSQKAYVIGLSATAKHNSVFTNFVPSALNNFNIRKESKHFQEQISEFITAKKLRASEIECFDILKCESMQKHVRIEDDVDRDKVYETLVNDKADIPKLREKVDALVGLLGNEKNKDFHFKRVIELIRHLQFFAQEPGVYGAVAIVNLDYSNETRWPLMREIIKLVDGLDEEMIVPLNTRRIKDGELEKGQKALKEGKQRIFLGSHGSISKAIDLNYTVDEESRKRRLESGEFIKINDSDYNLNAFDLNGFYYEKKSYIVPNNKDVGQDITTKSFYFISALYENGEIADKEKLFNKAFEKNGKSSLRELYKTNSAIESQAQMIFQCLGRLNRSHNKCKKLFIGFDEETFNLKRELPELFSESQLTPEQDAFVEIINQRKSEEEVDSCSDLNENLEYLFKIFANAAGEDGWSPVIEDYKLIRELVLHYPTITDEDIEKFARENDCDKDYVKNLVKLYYLEYDGCSYRFDWLSSSSESGYIPFAISKTGRECMSEKREDLEGLIEVKPFLKEFFEQENIPITYKKGEYIITPYLSDLRMGIIAESITDFLYERYFGTNLEDLSEDIFEVMDFKVRGKMVFIDVKNWKGTVDYDLKDIKALEIKREKLYKKYKDSGVSRDDIIFVYLNLEADDDYISGEIEEMEWIQTYPNFLADYEELLSGELGRLLSPDMRGRDE